MEDERMRIPAQDFIVKYADGFDRSVSLDAYLSGQFCSAPRCHGYMSSGNVLVHRCCHGQCAESAVYLDKIITVPHKHTFKMIVGLTTTHFHTFYCEECNVERSYPIDIIQAVMTQEGYKWPSDLQD